jgi:hypothetical protein
MHVNTLHHTISRHTPSCAIKRTVQTEVTANTPSVHHSVLGVNAHH